MRSTHQRRPSHPAVLLAVGMLCLSAPGVLAQDTAPKDSPLQGPKVTDRNVPGATPDFGMGGRGRRFADRVPPEVFRRAIGVLTSEDAPAEIRASEELRDTLRTSVDAFDEAVRKFRREHAKELEELRRAAGELPARRRGDAAPAAEPMKDLTPEERKARDEARVKLRELQASAPKIEDVYTKVWAELSEPQRAAVQAKLDEWSAQQAKRREDEYVRRQTRERDGGPAAPQRRPADGDAMAPKDAIAPMDATQPTDDAMQATKPEERPRARAAANQNPRRERLLRLFNQLSPEEQEQLLERLETRMRERSNGAPARRAKPAPDVDRVKVPEPDTDRK